jgi:hypothetical protein
MSALSGKQDMNDPRTVFRGGNEITLGIPCPLALGPIDILTEGSSYYHQKIREFLGEIRQTDARQGTFSPRWEKMKKRSECPQGNSDLKSFFNLHLQQSSPSNTPKEVLFASHHLVWCISSQTDCER